MDLEAGSVTNDNSTLLIKREPMSKITILFMMFFAFVIGFSSAYVANIKVVKIKGNIPMNADDPFWTRYGPTFHKHTMMEFDPQMITSLMCPTPATKWVNSVPLQTVWKSLFV